ncbi:MAG: thioredoxin family protein, partial [Promethearchaeota archaeon]
MLLERITEEFYQTGSSFDEFIQAGTEDEKERISLYYRRLDKKFTPENLRIELTQPVNLLIIATTWCWDSKTNVPVFVKIAEQNPNIN